MKKQKKKNFKTSFLSRETHNLMWCYLYFKKNLSQRKLAMRLVNDINKKGIHISVETVQRFFGKIPTQTPELLKLTLMRYFKKEGFSSEREIKIYIKKNIRKAKETFSYISSQEVIALSDLWVQVNGVKSKRRLAIDLKNLLENKGYKYHLGSLQNILCDKIVETKKIVLDGIIELLLKSSFKSKKEISKALGQLTDNQRSLYQPVTSDLLIEKCQEFLISNPQWTKRKLAIKLASDLKEKGFHISYNSLQYALAGKRSTVKKIVETTMSSYLSEPPTMIDLDNNKVQSRSRNLCRDISQIYHMVQNIDNPQKKQELSQVYLKTREQELKKLWLKRTNKFLALHQRSLSH